jgi:SHS2 domain-containing protein
VNSFDFFEHTADIGLKAFGKTQAQMFENAARGLYAALGEFVTGAEAVLHKLELTAPNVEELLVDFLRELHFLFDTRRWVFTMFQWHEITQTSLKVTLRGGTADFEKSTLNEEIKGVTYHHLKVHKGRRGWTAMLVLDV